MAELRPSGPGGGVSALASEGDQNASGKSVSFVPQVVGHEPFSRPNHPLTAT